MDDKNVETIIAKLEQAGGYVENLASSAWDVLVFGTRVEGVAGIAILFSVLLTLYLVGKKIVDSVHEYDKKEVSIFVLSINSLLGLFSILLGFNSFVKALAPEYAILKELVF